LFQLEGSLPQSVTLLFESQQLFESVDHTNIKQHGNVITITASSRRDDTVVVAITVLGISSVTDHPFSVGCTTKMFDEDFAPCHQL
jgi:Tfp pilus assembly protein PilN